MKKFRLLICFIMLFTLTGCDLFKEDTMENINILTTIYPIEYITNYLYGENAIVNSIYPDATNIDTYTFTEKQIKDNSKKDLFIYMDKSDDLEIAKTYLNKNNKLKLIDSTYGMKYQNSVDELWLNPTNMLMIAENIRNGLEEYLTSTILINEVNKKFNDLKIELSELDADARLSFENSDSKVIFTSNKALKYLEKYGLTVYVLDSNDVLFEKNLTIYNNYITNKKIKYYYNLENDIIPTEIQELIDGNKVKLITLKNLKNITDNERNNKVDYIEISKQNIESIKEELYQ